MDNAEYKKKLTEFLGDHKRHVDELSQAVRSEEGAPPDEDVTNTKYEEAVKATYPEQIQAILRQGLADEQRHRDWLIATLEKD